MKTRKMIAFALLAIPILAGCVLLYPRKAQRMTAPYDRDRLASYHRFVPIEEGKIYSSKEPNEEFLLWLMRQKGVKTFISLKGNISLAKEDLIIQNGGRLEKFGWTYKKVPPEAEIFRAIDLMRDPANQPVHFFCTSGHDRTGFLRAYYRFFYQGWTKDEALGEFYALGHLPNVLDKYLREIFIPLRGIQFRRH